MQRDAEIVIVGGGIAGMSAASALASDGNQVIVLEASLEYADRVRGESLMPWGVAEAEELGVLHTLIEADARITETWVHYDELIPAEVSLANRISVGSMLSGVSGSLNLRHPEACAALAKLAADDGARVERGVSGVAVSPGPKPEVRAQTTVGQILEFHPRLVIGADGRNSTVRNQIGIELHRHHATHIGADATAAQHRHLHGVDGDRGLRQPAGPAGQILRDAAERAFDDGHGRWHVRRP